MPKQRFNAKSASSKVTGNQIPVYSIQHNCADRSVSFKIATLDDKPCATTEFDHRHRHEYFEIIWIKAGSGIHKIDGHDHEYDGSTLFVLTPGQIHQIVQKTPAEGYLIRFLPAFFNHDHDYYDVLLDTCLFDTNSSCPIIRVPEDLTAPFEHIFDQLLSEYKQPDENTDLLALAYLKIIITHIGRLKREKLNQQIAITHPDYRLFRAFKIAIEKNFKSQHRVQGYANQLNTTTKSLNAVTRKYASKSAGELIQERLVLEAERILHHEGLSVKELCYELGFDDPSYFSRFFKKHTGLSPAEFKQRQSLNSV